MLSFVKKNLPLTPESMDHDVPDQAIGGDAMTVSILSTLPASQVESTVEHQAQEDSIMVDQAEVDGARTAEQ